jgi:hypothetical protein
MKKQDELERIKKNYELSMIKDYKLLSLEDIEKAIDRVGDTDDLYGYGVINIGILVPILEEMAKKNHKEREERRCNSCGLISSCTCWAGVR